MLAAMGSGEKEMFEGMDVNEPGSCFRIGETPYSVILLDFSNAVVEPTFTLDQVRAAIADEMKCACFDQHGIEISCMNPGDILKEWIRKLKRLEGTRIVLLIDEYDAPVTSFLPENPLMAQSVASMLKPLYQVIKGYGDYFHKVFVTGVSKFSSTSMFSGPNQFLPLMERSAEFVSLYGFTDSEIRSTYGEFIETKFEKPLDEVMEDIKRMYNGYRIHPMQKDEELLFNPWSVLNYFDTGQLIDYWAQSAGSSSVIPMLGLHGVNLVDGFEITQDRLFANISAKEYNNHWKQMAFQSGYSSIKRCYGLAKDFDPKRTIMKMGPPNQEVREFLQGRFSEYIVGLVNPDLLDKYKKYLFGFEFEKASSVLGDMIAQQRFTPSNEIEFAAFAIYSLMTIKKPSDFLDIAFEHGVRLDHEDRSRGKYPTFDGAILLRHESCNVLLVIELKFESKGGIKQIAEQDYIRRARYFFEKRNPGLIIAREVAICFNLVISPEIKVIFEQ
jgi:hypothetical protein